MRLIPFAMVRITAVFIAGILAAIFFPGLLMLGHSTVFLIILTIAYFPTRWYLGLSSATRLATGIIGLGAVFFAGYVDVQLHDESLRHHALIQKRIPIQAYKVKLLSTTEERKRSWKRTGSVVAIRTEAGWQPTDGKINLYWPKEEDVKCLDYGDMLLIQGQPTLVAAPQNPFEFDYRDFLRAQNIFHQHYVGRGKWKVVQQSANRGPLFFAGRARGWTMDIIEKYVTGLREQAIVKAFVVGVKDGIDDALKELYVAGGAMHVLAVSGLHVGILYGIMIMLLSPVHELPGGRWIVVAGSLTVLWSYAFITGLSPSVLRAVTMFSFAAIAKPLRRRSSIFNTLAASAFLLLIFEPLLILSVGFQLSYLAVIGIIALYRPIYNLWVPKGWWLDWIWRITCISLTAQLGTVALTLYYFHQFPVYFMIANLFVIPGAFLILVGGIVLLVISQLSWLAAWLGVGIERIVSLLNDLLFQLEKMPFSVVNGIHLTPLQSLCIGGIIISTFLLLKSRRFYWIVVLMSVVLVFSLASWKRTSRLNNLVRFTTYHVPGNRAFEWFTRSAGYFVADSVLQADEARIKYHIAPHRLESGIQQVQSVSFEDLRHKGGMLFFRFGGKAFLCISSKDALLPDSLHADYLIIGRNSIESLQSLSGHINFDYLIFDSSNSLRYCDQLQREAQRLQKPCFSVLRQGAFTVNL